MENLTGSNEQQEFENLPSDFSSRIASKIIFTSERERDPDVALEKIGNMLLRNLGAPNRIKYFMDVMDALEADPETTRFSGLSWASLMLDREEDPRFEKLIQDILESMIQGHLRGDREEHELEYRRRKVSFYARNLGESFIAMMNINAELYEVISEIFSKLIRAEMQLENQKKESGPNARKISFAKKSEEEDRKTGKKLFDDVVDYIHARGEQRVGTLHQNNPNEFISVLADRLRSTRRYVIQDLLNRQAMARRKEAEKELSEKLAGAEEIILAKDNFKRGMKLYWTEKQYNFKYMAVEKVRATVYVLSMIVGIMIFLIGYSGISGLLWWEGIVGAVGMFLFAKFLCSRRFFRNFFPEDVSKELEVVVGSFTPTLRKMSHEQLDSFLHRQVKDSENLPYLFVLSEFVRYVFAVMPDRNNVVVEREELAEVVQNMEMDVARSLRTMGGQLPKPRA
ncbi:MAG: hypothetical protein OEW39_12030 [Deltaproteobacteria bacterium]|nr:hypothetical protein [Deltaproteobacteria bacterium]